MAGDDQLVGWRIGLRISRSIQRLEGDELALAKAKTLCDSIVKVQAMGPDGEIATHWVISDLTGVKCINNWTNCGVGAAMALQEMASVVE